MSYFVNVDAAAGSLDNRGVSEHAFLATILFVVSLEVAVVALALGYYGYQIRRSVERTEGLTAATFLEVRKVLSQSR